MAEALVRGEPDDEWGEVVVACIVPADRSDPPSVDALRAFARDQLPPYALPRRLELTEVLPRTPLGKLRREAPRPPQD